MEGRAAGNKGVKMKKNNCQMRVNFLCHLNDVELCTYYESVNNIAQCCHGVYKPENATMLCTCKPAMIGKWRSYNALFNKNVIKGDKE